MSSLRARSLPLPCVLPALVLVAVVLLSSASVFAADSGSREHVQDLLRRVATGGPPLSDEELELVLAVSHTDEVDVALVMMSAVVVDRRGRPAAGLVKDDFEVFDDGRRRPIVWFNEELGRPFRIVLLLDVSGSMGVGMATAEIRAALLPLTRQIRHGDRVKLISFASRGIQEHTGWSRRPMRVLDEALRIPRHGKTALADALAAAAGLLPEAPQDRQAIVLVSDGIDNASHLTAEEAAQAARAVDVPVYVIALGGPSREIQWRRSDTNPLDVLQRVAQLTGGRFFLVGGPDDTAVAAQVAVQIRDDLRHQYWLAIRAAGPRNGAFHELRLKVRRRGAKVLTRQGYR